MSESAIEHAIYSYLLMYFLAYLAELFIHVSSSAGWTLHIIIMINVA